jgi:hypothetical protein
LVDFHESLKVDLMPGILGAFWQVDSPDTPGGRPQIWPFHRLVCGDRSHPFKLPPFSKEEAKEHDSADTPHLELVTAVLVDFHESLKVDLMPGILGLETDTPGGRPQIWPFHRLVCGDRSHPFKLPPFSKETLQTRRTLSSSRLYWSIFMSR